MASRCHSLWLLVLTRGLETEKKFQSPWGLKWAKPQKFEFVKSWTPFGAKTLQNYFDCVVNADTLIPIWAPIWWLF